MATQEEKRAPAPWDKAPEEEKKVEDAALRREIERRAKLERLREPFPDRAIGKLPKVTCSVCSKERETGQKCGQHQKRKCEVCDAYISTAHIHLDYVGHAEVTDRFLTVDSEWNWEPLSRDPNGQPLFVRAASGHPVGLWIRLTILGVTRLGYGSVDGRAFDPEKQLIGDALRNAAMRFGVALTLWSKNELESTLDAETVDTKTGEVTTHAAKDLDESRRMSEEVAAWDPNPRAAEPKPRRMISGIPITIDKTWEQVKDVPVSNLNPKSPFAKLSLGELIDEEKDDGRIEYLEGDVMKKVFDQWNRLAPKKKADGLPLPWQLVLIAYDELQRRRSPEPPADDSGKAVI